MESILIPFSCIKEVSEEYSTSGKHTGLSLTLCAHRNAKNCRGPAWTLEHQGFWRHSVTSCCVDSEFPWLRPFPGTLLLM